jgi:hypothetical protein
MTAKSTKSTKSTKSAKSAAKSSKSAANSAKPAKAAKAADKPIKAADKPTASRTPSHDEIAERAYFIHLEEGGCNELENWLRAESELTTA